MNLARTASAFGIFLVLGAGGLVAGGLAVLMERSRATQIEDYERERVRQRKVAGATRAAEEAPVPEGGRKRCVRDVDTFAVAVQRELKVSVPEDPRGRIDALREISRIAALAEREVELSRQAPALPKRMGSVRDLGPDGQAVWRAVEPETPACGGKAYAEFTVK